MIILSKSVRKECRGAIYGFNYAAGSLGGLSALLIGNLLIKYIGNSSANYGSVLIALLMVGTLFKTKIYKNPYI